MKKQILCLASLLMLVGAGQAHAAQTDKAPTAQQNRMKTCAAQDHEKKIAKSQYHAFMSKCLKKPGSASKKPAAQ